MCIIKRTYGLLAILVIAVILSGCVSGGGDSETTTPAPTTAAPTTTPAPTTVAPTEPPKPAEMNDAWGMQYHDAFNSNYSTSSLPGTPDVLWYKDGIINGPSVIEYGMVYVPVQKLNDVNSTRLVCLDIQDGSLEWEHALDYNRTVGCGRDNHYRAPAVSDGKVVYLSCGNSCILQCYDAYDGTLLWKSTIDEVYHVYQTPVIYEGKIFTAYMNSVCDVEADTMPEDLNDGTVCCYDLETGDMTWEEDFDMALFGMPVLYEGKVYIAAVDGSTAIGYLICLDASDGDLLWMNELLEDDRRIFYIDEPIWQIAYGHGNIYVTLFDFDKEWEFFGYCSLVCLDPATGEMRWEFRTDNGTFFDNHLVVSEEYVYFSSLWNRGDGNDATELYKIDPANGNRLWQKDVPNFMNFISMGGNTLYLGDSESVYDADAQMWVRTNHVYGINGTSGAQNWHFSEVPDFSDIKFNDGINPSISDGYMVVSLGFRLYCFS